MNKFVKYACACSLLTLAACAENTPDIGDTDIDSVTESVIQTAEDAKAAMSEESISVDVINRKREIIGTINIEPLAGGGVYFTGELSGISEGEHGMHFHVKGDCSAEDFTSAGGHINPEERSHGLNHPEGPDNADMPNAVANANGIVTLERTHMRVDLRPGGNNPALLDEDGSALIIHINPDDQITQPIGGAGARIACGAITAQ